MLLFKSILFRLLLNYVNSKLFKLSFSYSRIAKIKSTVQAWMTIIISYNALIRCFPSFHVSRRKTEFILLWINVRWFYRFLCKLIKSRKMYILSRSTCHQNSWFSIHLKAYPQGETRININNISIALKNSYSRN